MSFLRAKICYSFMKLKNIFLLPFTITSENICSSGLILLMEVDRGSIKADTLVINEFMFVSVFYLCLLDIQHRHRLFSFCKRGVESWILNV